MYSSGDNYLGPGSPLEPDDDPMDRAGHGTHVSGIIGARAASPEGVTGVTFYAKKVFGPEGPTGDDTILAALEAAYEDGADVINMSLGSAFERLRKATLPDGSQAGYGVMTFSLDPAGQTYAQPRQQ